MYYRFHWDAEAGLKGLKLAIISEQPDTGVTWLTGKHFKRKVDEPIRCLLDPSSGPDMPDVFLFGEIPIFSNRLVEALHKAGVDNIDIYEAILVAPETKKVWKDYKAVNIVGKIECANLNKSEYDQDSEYPMIEFEKLILDEKKIEGVKMFRLAENPSFILINEDVKEVIDRSKWVGLRILSLDDFEAY